MATISALTQEILAEIFEYGADIRIGNPHDEPEQTREKYLRRTSLVCRAWRRESQRLLFRRPFINSVEKFNDFTASAKAKGIVDEVTQATIHCKMNKPDIWMKLLKDFVKEFGKIEWLELRCRASRTHKVEMEWLAPISGTLRTLTIRHFNIHSVPASSELAFPAMNALILEHGDIVTAGKKESKSLFSIMPSLTVLKYDGLPTEKKTFAGKFKTSLLHPPRRKVRGQSSPPPLSILPNLTSLELLSANSAINDLQTLEHFRDLLGAFTSLKHLSLTLDFLHLQPTLSPHILELTLSRSYPTPWSDLPLTSTECPRIQALLPTLPALVALHSNYLWAREAKSKEDPSHLAALESLQKACEERGVKMDRPEGGLGDHEDFTAWHEALQVPPVCVGDEYVATEEEERKMTKEETLWHWSRFLQRAFLSPGGVREKMLIQDLEEAANYLYWMQGWILSDFTLDSKLLYVLNRIAHLPDGAIPEAAEAKHNFRWTARHVASNLGGAEDEEGERVAV
ncbi:hypothetical protein P7C70_g7850, partial [Phenoliferia sp. Uapishka_3]